MIPPKAFSIVEPQVYRSSVFSREHFPFIRQLKLRTIVYLSSEAVPKSLIEFCKEEEGRINLLSLGTKEPVLQGRLQDWSPLRGDLAKLALEAILNVDNSPIIIVCLSGAQQTGTVVGCLRRLQGWSFTSIVEEHRRYTEVLSRSTIEHYIEMFDVEVVNIPARTPEWFAFDMKLLEEEEEQFKRENSKDKQKVIS